MMTKLSKSYLSYQNIYIANLLAVISHLKQLINDTRIISIFKCLVWEKGKVGHVLNSYTQAVIENVLTTTSWLILVDKTFPGIINLKNVSISNFLSLYILLGRYIKVQHKEVITKLIYKTLCNDKQCVCIR